jgi:hypothetical protein
MDRRNFMIGAGATSALAAAVPLFAGLASAESNSGSMSSDQAAAAYLELAELLGEIESGYIGPSHLMHDAAERAAGRYFVANAIQHAFQFVFDADPSRPMFHRWFTPKLKLLGDNPDAVYYGCMIDPSRSFRIRGNVHGATYTSFTAESGTRDGGLSRRLVSTLNDTEFDVASDGSYEIIASPEPQPRNWLKLEPDVGSLTTRHYFEWERSVAADPTLHIPLSIEPQGDPGPAAPMGDAEVAAGIRRVVTFVRSVTLDFLPPERLPSWVSQEVNQFANPAEGESNQSIGYAAKDNQYRQTNYEIETDEALVIRGRFPRCRFANVVLWNHHMQTPPYRRRRVSLNRRQVAYEDDGSFRIVVAHRDPGVPNWIDAAGARTGAIFWRFQLSEDAIPPLWAELVPVQRVGRRA